MGLGLESLGGNKVLVLGALTHAIRLLVGNDVLGTT